MLIYLGEIYLILETGIFTIENILLYIGITLEVYNRIKEINTTKKSEYLFDIQVCKNNMKQTDVIWMKKYWHEDGHDDVNENEMTNLHDKLSNASIRLKNIFLCSKSTWMLNC